MDAEKLYLTLTHVGLETWCEFLFNRDLLAKKVDAPMRQQLIKDAIDSGEELAAQVRKEHPGMDTIELADELCEVEYGKSQNISQQLFLATFRGPNKIKIYNEPIQKLAALNIAGFPEQTIRQIVMGHELFHYYEDKDPNIASRMVKIPLWHFLGYEHKSTVRAVSEIAAMVFSWRVQKLPYSPLVLDIMLLNIYNQDAVTPALEELKQAGMAE